MTLFLLLWPEAMVTEDCGTFKSLAKNAMQVVGTAVERGRGQSDFQGIAQFAGDRVFLGAGMDSYREADALVGFVDRKHRILLTDYAKTMSF